MADFKSSLGFDFSSLDDMFSTQDMRDNGEIKTVKINDIVPFKDHTFKVRQIDELAESIKNNGLMVPGIAFMNEDGLLELIAGHRRCEACKKLGMDTFPVIIRNVNRDDATIIMGETNLQTREVILPSEKAFTYKAMYDAMKRKAGRPSKENSSPVATNFKKGRSDKELGELVGESKDQIHRYIRLTELIPELLELVDAKVMGLRPAVELSYIDSGNQRSIYDYYEEGEVKDEEGNIQIAGTLPSLAQAKELRALAEKHGLDEEVIEKILDREKPNQKEKFIIKDKSLLAYKSRNNMDAEAFERKIAKALDFYDKYKDRFAAKNKDMEKTREI